MQQLLPAPVDAALLHKQPKEMLVFLSCCCGCATRFPLNLPCSSCSMFSVSLSAHSASICISLFPFLHCSPPRSFLRSQSSLLLLQPCTTHPPSPSLSSHQPLLPHSPHSSTPHSSHQQGLSIHAPKTAGPNYLSRFWKWPVCLSPTTCVFGSACLSFPRGRKWEVAPCCQSSNYWDTRNSCLFITVPWHSFWHLQSSLKISAQTGFIIRIWCGLMVRIPK